MSAYDVLNSYVGANMKERMKNRVWIGIILICTVLFLFGNPVVSAEETLDLSATSAILIDAENGRVLYEKNGYEEKAMASTTKIMTLLCVLQYGNMEDIVTVSSYAASMPDVQLNIRKGEQYYMQDLVYSLMLESHNDVAVAIAEHIGGDVEGFAALMNEMAYDLGAYHTHFVTPNGLDAEGHYSTAYDMALIARYAILNEEFVAITNTRNYSFSDVAGNRHFVATNRNAFLSMYEGAIGVKTGFTGNAGYCFVGAVKRDGRTLIAVVLGCGWPPHKTYKWKDMRRLFDYGFQNYTYKTVYEPTDEVKRIPVHDGIEKSSVGVYTNETVSLLLKADENVRVNYDLPVQLEAPVKKDSRVGSVNIYINDMFYQSVPVYAGEEIEKIDFWYCVRKVLKQFTLHTIASDTAKE